MLLAEALLRRKELQNKVEQLKPIKVGDLFQTKVQRKKVSEDIDDIVAAVPVLSAKQVTAEFDFYAKQLRYVDALIQKANWTTEVQNDTGVDLMADYVPPVTLSR